MDKRRYAFLCQPEDLPLTSFTDHEIFRLKDEIDQSEGQGTTFYDFLEIHRSASQSDINKAYRKRSRVLHPDKAREFLIASRAAAAAAVAAESSTKPGAKPTAHANKPPTAREFKAAEKEASERFTRLGLITEILRGEGRERYDHFLDNGFPTWRGTGYYYARFRPGIASVLAGLFIFGGGLVHYVVLLLGYYRQRDFVGRYIRQAQRAAWGEEGKPSALRNVRGLGRDDKKEAEGATVVDDDYEVQEAPKNRRERREQEKEVKRKKKEMEKEKKRDKSVDPGEASTPIGQATSTIQSFPASVAGAVTPAPGPKKQVEAENGKILVVDSVGKVFLEEEDAETGETQLFLLDPEEIERPSFRQTVLWRLPAWCIGEAQRRISRTKAEAPIEKGPIEETKSEDDIGDVVVVEKEDARINVDAETNSNGKKARKRKAKK